MKEFGKVLKISLQRSEWNSVGTWIQAMAYKKFQRVDKSDFNDLYDNFLQPISIEINFSNKDYKYDVDIDFEIPRMSIRYFIASIGNIAYDLDCKPITNIIARNILEKINFQIKNQLQKDDTYFIYGY